MKYYLYYKQILIAILIFNLFNLVQIWLFFDRFGFKFQYIIQFDFGTYSLDSFQFNFLFGIDGISIFFLLLTFLISILAIISIYKNNHIYLVEYTIYLMIIKVILLLAFTTLDLFLFFVFFESVLIPMYILIGKWGSRARKIKANFYFFLYTLAGSILLLFVIISLYFEVGTTMFCILQNILLDSIKIKLSWLLFFIAFGVKIPIFPFHLWLPEAHVEAPTVGSVFLASLLLKLGGYGILRVLLPCCTIASYYYTPIVFVLCLLGIVNASMCAIRQVDIKRIIAYSSVAHMNFTVLGLFAFNIEGLQGALFLMIAHGIVSAALFFNIGSLYEKYHSKNIFYYGGLVTVMPLFSFYFMVFCFANVALPVSCNFVGELLIIISLIEKNVIALFFASFSVILSVLYTITMLNRIIFGNLKTTYIKHWIDISKTEHLINLPLAYLTILLGIQPNIVLDTTFSTIFYLTQTIYFF